MNEKQACAWRILRKTVPASIVMDSVGSKLASMIEYQLPQGTKPPEFVYQLINYQYAVLCIDLGKLPTGQHHPGCIIQNYANLDTSPIPFMSVNMPRWHAVLSFITNPLPALLFLQIFLGQTCCLQVHVYAIMWYADLKLFPDHSLQHARSKAIVSVGCSGDQLFRPRQVLARSPCTLWWSAGLSFVRPWHPAQSFLWAPFCGFDEEYSEPSSCSISYIGPCVQA